MTDRIPASIIETLDPNKPVRLTPAQAGVTIHTRSFTGLYRNLRLLGGAVLFLLYFGTLWLNWDGRQAVLWDLGTQQFHIFGATFWPQDFILLSALLIIASSAPPVPLSHRPAIDEGCQRTHPLRSSGMVMRFPTR